MNFATLYRRAHEGDTTQLLTLPFARVAGNRVTEVNKE